jgi:hypothetical protein
LNRGSRDDVVEKWSMRFYKRNSRTWGFELKLKLKFKLHVSRKQDIDIDIYSGFEVFYSGTDINEAKKEIFG